MRLSHLLLPFHLIAKLVSVLCVLLVLTVEPVGAQGNTPITINFDDLANKTIVTDQYLNQYGVKFSSGNLSFPLHTQQACNFCGPISPPNFVCTWPDLSGQVFVEFTRPVSNLSFVINASDAFFSQFAVLDVYRNGSFFSSFNIFGNGTDLQNLNLDDWYEPLEPGLYRLINRCRFEVRGQWSVDSEELLFEVLP